MDQLNILLKMKDLLKSTCGRQVIACLMQYPLILEFLNDTNNFQIAVDHFGDECSLWTPANIGRIAIGFDNNISFSDKRDFAKNIQKNPTSTPDVLITKENNTNLIEIFSTAQHIISFKKDSSWQDIFDQFGLKSDLLKNSKKIYETVFSIVYELNENKDELLGCLVDYRDQDSGPKLFARLIMMNPPIGEMAIESFKSIFSHTSLENFLSLIKELQFLGDQKYGSILARRFIEIHPFDESGLQRKGLDELTYDLANLLYIKNYAALFQICENKNDAGRISSFAKNILVSIGQKFDIKTNPVDINFINDEDTFLKSEIYGSELVSEIKRIESLTKTDIESAISSAEELSKKLLKDIDLENALFHGDFGFLIKPENLIQVFIDLKLVFQTQSLLNRLLLSWPQNLPLLKIAANFSYDNGDHQDSIERFSQLDIFSDLSREEKIKFASSLEYRGRWQAGFNIRKSINITNESDMIDVLLSAYYSDNDDALKNLLSDFASGIQSPILFSILRKISQKENVQNFYLEDELNSLDSSNEIFQRSILLAADIYQKAGEYEKAENILEKSAKKSFDFIFNCQQLILSLSKVGRFRKKSVDA